VVLLLVLVLVATSIMLVYAMAKTTLLDAKRAERRIETARAQLLARSGVAIAVRALQDDAASQDPIEQAMDSAGDAWALLSAQPIEIEGGGTLHIRVRDAGSKISINALVDADGARIGEISRGFLVTALEAIVDHTPALRQSRWSNDERRAELADAILDWIDRDEETRIGTPEETHYERADSAPLNRPVFSLDELAGVPEMDPLLLEGLAAYFSPYPIYPTQTGGGGVNLNTAPAHVLALLYHGAEFDMRLVNDDDVYRLLKARDDDRLFCPTPSEESCTTLEAELHTGSGEEVFPPLQYQGSVFYVDIEARYGRSRACVHTVIDRGQPAQPKTMLYRLGC
jgi:type II secretory pathway component PulK